jgi:ATP-dependent Zn protease
MIGPAIVAGLEKRNRLLNPMERRVVAYDELGHTLVALALPGTNTVHRVSIIPRASAHSVTRYSGRPRTAIW